MRLVVEASDVIEPNCSLVRCPGKPCSLVVESMEDPRACEGIRVPLPVVELPELLEPFNLSLTPFKLTLKFILLLGGLGEVGESANSAFSKALRMSFTLTA